LTVNAPVPPPPSGATPANFTVAFIGDQGTTSDADAVLQLIKTKGARLVIHSGDFDYSDNPTTFDNRITTILGSKFPYLISRGNHDEAAWGGASGYQAKLQARIDRHNTDPATPPDDKITCTGTGANLALKSSCLYQGLRVLLIDPRAFTDEDLYIRQELANSTSIWNICSWHYDQTAMQISNRDNDVGWADYEECRKGGAIIATAHAHSYARTRTLSNTQTQTVDPAWPGATALRVVPGSTFVFHSGLGGRGIGNQERCLPTTFPYGCNGEWAKIYASEQSARFGALFITFNVDGDPKKARGAFFNIRDSLTPIDSFTITADPSASPPP
jgi:3',5'-cyclic AMP phosphodiesterase CpdA